MNAVALDHSTVLLIGGPDAGKSNFLFRLWIAVDDGRGALTKDGLPSELEYLRSGAEKLLEGEYAGHTSKEVYERISVPLKSSPAETGRSSTLVVPDLAGEQVLAIFRNRQWPSSWEELISNRCACLIFIRAGSDEIVAPLDWATCFEKYGAVIEPPPEHTHAVEGIDSEEVKPPEDPKTSQAPTQVVLTDWLQFLRRAFTAIVGGAFRPRVGVVITAWDAVPAEQQSAGPMPYLRENFPMLSQFIDANDDRFEFQTFGVSIVDGDLKNDEEFRERYLKGKPQDFGLVLHTLAGQLKTSSDITLPVAWALGL